MDTEFGRYRLLGLIGEGGMGKVYRAHDTAIDRDVAIKVLPADLANEPGYRERFRREAHTAARLNEPHIIPIYDTGEIEGQLYLVMPVIDGVDAHGLLKRDGAMPPERAVRVIEQLAAALDAAHAQGLVHRDVKPSNALISPSDFAYLIDFGIARGAAGTKLTSTGAVVGTLAYMAPERFATGTAERSSDVYSLACMLYECLIADQPYPGNSMEQQIASHLYSDPPRPSEHRPSVPVGFDEVIARGMAKSPDLRYQCAGDLAAAARAALNTALPELSARTFGRTKSPQSAEPVLENRHMEPVAETQLPVAAELGAEPTQLAPTQLARPSDPQSRAARRPLTVPSRMQSGRKGILLGTTVAIVVLTVLGVVYVSWQKDNTATSTPAGPAFSPAAELDGTYRMVLSAERTTLNGMLNPPDAQENVISWWAFRSSCNSDGCKATGTNLDKADHELANTNGLTEEFLFVDDRWVSTLTTDRVPRQTCFYDHDQPTEGKDTISNQFSLAPQPDGTLRGTLTQTVITDECGLAGGVISVPVTLTRSGDAPSGVSIADPATATVITSPAIQPVAGPSLAGVYRMDIDGAGIVVDGVPTPETSKASYWWAFRSVCTASGCVAIGATLDQSNHRQAGGRTEMFHFVDGVWQGAPSYERVRCNSGPNAGEKATVRETMEVRPQPDGTISALSRLSWLTPECGDDQGRDKQFPFAVTRTGDIPPTVTVADPALFVS